jgi:hypothetical protein
MGFPMQLENDSRMTRKFKIMAMVGWALAEM